MVAVNTSQLSEKKEISNGVCLAENLNVFVILNEYDFSNGVCKGEKCKLNLKCVCHIKLYHVTLNIT